MLHRDVADQFHHVHRLAHARTAEQTHLAALGERADQINHLNAGFQQFIGCSEFVERRRFTVDRPAFFIAHRALLVDWVAQHIHNAAQRFNADWHGYRRACAGYGHTAPQAIGGAHGNRTYYAVPQLLLHFQRQVGAAHFQGIINSGQGFTRKLHVNHWTDNLYDFSLAHHQSLKQFRILFRRRYTAAAPATISDSSLVMAACRDLLYINLSSSITLPALSDAAFIATMRALCSDAIFSVTA